MLMKSYWIFSLSATPFPSSPYARCINPIISPPIFPEQSEQSQKNTTIPIPTQFNQQPSPHNQYLSPPPRHQGIMPPNTSEFTTNQSTNVATVRLPLHLLSIPKLTQISPIPFTIRFVIEFGYIYICLNFLYVPHRLKTVAVSFPISPSPRVMKKWFFEYLACCSHSNYVRSIMYLNIFDSLWIYWAPRKIGLQQRPLNFIFVRTN